MVWTQWGFKAFPLYCYAQASFDVSDTETVYIFKTIHYIGGVKPYHPHVEYILRATFKKTLIPHSPLQKNLK